MAFQNEFFFWNYSKINIAEFPRGKGGGGFIVGWVQNYVRGWTRENFSSAVRSSIASRCPVWWWSYLGSSSGVWHLRFRRNTSSEDLWHGEKSARACPPNDNTVLELARAFVKSFEGLRITCLIEHFRPRNKEMTILQGKWIHRTSLPRFSWYSRSSKTKRITKRFPKKQNCCSEGENKNTWCLLHWIQYVSGPRNSRFLKHFSKGRNFKTSAECEQSGDFIYFS